MILPALCASTLSPERVKARMTKTRVILSPSRNSISALVSGLFCLAYYKPQAVQPVERLVETSTLHTCTKQTVQSFVQLN